MFNLTEAAEKMTFFVLCLQDIYSVFWDLDALPL